MTTLLNFAKIQLGSMFLNREIIRYVIIILAFTIGGNSATQAQTSHLVLNGITIRTGFTLNWSENELSLSASSAIFLAPEIHTVSFAASDEVVWTGDTLTITGWTGTAGSSGTAGKIFVGTDTTGLTSDQLAKINFTGYEGTATILSTGEVVPVAAGPSESVISNVSGSSNICAGSIAIIRITITGGTSPYTVVYSDGSNNFTVNNYISGADIQVMPDTITTYTIVSVTDINNMPGSDNSGSATITVTSSMVSTSLGTNSATMNHTDGATLNYIDASCNLLSGIEDTLGGNVLGVITVLSTLLDSPPLPQMANSQTFGPRYHTITPTSSGDVNITFYYLQSDFTTYNATNGTLDMPTSGNNMDPNINNIKIAQIDTGDTLSTTISYTPTLVNYNATDAYWEVTINDVMLPSMGAEFYFYGEANCALNIDLSSISIDSITTTSAIVSWDAVIGASGYVVRWRTGADTWNTAVTPQTSLNITFLNAGSVYEVQVRVICNNGYGLNSNSVSFSTLTALSECVAPTGLAATGITTKGAVVSWDAVANNVVSYTIRWRISPSGSWTQATTSMTSRNLNPWLLSGTTYDIQVRTNCSGAETNQSDWSPIVQFATNAALPLCTVPTGLAATGITTKGAVIVWNAVANNALSYTVRWRVSPVGVWNQATSNMTSRNLNPWLSSGTTYDLQVRTNCSGAQTNQSDWSPVVQFTTNSALPVCEEPTGLAATGITTNGAVIVWNAVANNAVSYTLRWRVSPVGNWNQATTTTTSRNLNPWLLAGTTYDLQVRTNCSGAQTNQSDWSSIIQFSTNTAFSNGDQHKVHLLSALRSQHSDVMNGDILDISIFPNPTSDILNLTFDSPKANRINIRFVDVTGRLVYEIQQATSEGFNSMQINIGNLQDGVYMMQMFTPDRLIYMGRVVKTN